MGGLAGLAFFLPAGAFDRLALLLAVSGALGLLLVCSGASRLKGCGSEFPPVLWSEDGASGALATTR